MTSQRASLVVGLMVLLLAAAVVAHGRPGDVDQGFGAAISGSYRWSPAVAVDGTIRGIEFWSSENCCFPGGTTYQGYLATDSRGTALPGTKVEIDRARYGHLRSPMLVARDNDLLVSTSPADTTLIGGGVRAPSGQAGILKLAPDGRANAQFGSDGIAWLPVEALPRITGSNRAVSAMTQLADGRIVAVVSDSCPYADTRQSPYPVTSFEYGATDAAQWGVPVTSELCLISRRLEHARALLRLLPDGRVDTTFGSSGTVTLETLAEITLLGVQPDGVIVLADRKGHVRRFAPDGRQLNSLDVDLQDASGFSLADGSLLLAGRRPSLDQKLWIARFNPDLSPSGGNQGLTGFDIGKATLGRDAMSVYPLEMRGSTDGRQAYVAINLATTATRDYLCGGIVRVDLGNEIAVDPAFGQNGFACETRSGFTGGETHLVPHPVEGLLLHGPAIHYMDRWYFGEDNFFLQKIQTVDRESGPGRLNVQGMNHAVWREPGQVRLLVGRTGGRRGSVGVTWKVEVGTSFGVPQLALTGVPRSGALQWADGDDSDREIVFQLPPVATDKDRSRASELRVFLADPTGGAAIDRNTTGIFIRDVEGTLAQANPRASQMDPAQSGGGALGVPGLLGLLTLLGAHLLRRKRLVACVMLAGATGTCAAAPGDIDPGFGDRGRVVTPYAPLVGTDGRLSLLNVDGTTVTVMDANGKPVTGASFAIPRTNGVRSVYGWAHDLEGSYLIKVTMDTAEGVQSGLMRLDAQGRLDSRFGVGGIVVVHDVSRRVAESAGPYQPQSLLIDSIEVLADGRLLLLEWELPYPSCLKSWGLAIAPDFDACWGWVGIDGPEPTWMRRLRSDGSLDESFGVGGRASVGSLESFAKWFAVRADGSPVLVEERGQIRTYTPDGRQAPRSQVSFNPSGGAALPDGGLLLVGRRNETPRGVWVTRLDAQLRPVVASGDVNGEIRIDLAGLYSGDTSGESYFGKVRLSPDARYAYFPASYVNVSNSRGRCGGAARLRLDGAPVLDESFGQHGLACLFADQADDVMVLPSGDVVLHSGDPSAMYRLHGADVPGPGYIRFTGAVYGHNHAGGVDEGAGTATIRMKRMSGKTGPVSVEWKIIGTQGNPSISGAQSGRVEWADGDNADKIVTLALLDDQLPSPLNPASGLPFQSTVTFALQPVDATPPGAVVSQNTFQLYIQDNDSPSLASQYEAINAANTQNGGDGGGGALGAWALLALGALWRRRSRFARAN